MGGGEAEISHSLTILGLLEGEGRHVVLKCGYPLIRSESRPSIAFWMDGRRGGDWIPADGHRDMLDGSDARPSQPPPSLLPLSSECINIKPCASEHCHGGHSLSPTPTLLSLLDPSSALRGNQCHARIGSDGTQRELVAGGAGVNQRHCITATLSAPARLVGARIPRVPGHYCLPFFPLLSGPFGTRPITHCLPNPFRRMALSVVELALSLAI